MNSVSLLSLTQHWVHLPWKQPHPYSICFALWAVFCRLLAALWCFFFYTVLAVCLAVIYEGRLLLNGYPPFSEYMGQGHRSALIFAV